MSVAVQVDVRMWSDWIVPGMMGGGLDRLDVAFTPTRSLNIQLMCALCSHDILAVYLGNALS